MKDENSVLVLDHVHRLECAAHDFCLTCEDAFVQYEKGASAG